ncbi:AMP-binding protein [Sphingosinicella microcystinivorans]|uniref:AMP-binding protein n=1 Tax=Sphingosinicella microcystinivorans TaxID=335406 RepID=UPI0022F3E91A|nr:AMP-binding protein [Sphingosinicella microcystinivorans]WBX85355.1 AMP-binding protein [Sphingosinicella microcystinivorans]
MDTLADLAERTVHGLLQQRAAERPDDPFLHFEDRAFTFGALHEAASRLAGGLAALGVGRGDKVAIMMGNRPEFLLCWFALSQLGAVEVPINTAHRGTLLHYMLDQAECSLLILEGAFQDRLADIAADLPKLRTVALLDGKGPDGIPQRIIDFRTLKSAAPLADAPSIGPADPVAVMFTSGTTGPSKGAVLPQNYVLMQAAIIAEACRYTPGDCLYNALPLFHGNAQFLSTIPALLSGARMVLARRFSASAFWDEVRAHGCTAFNYIGGILPILWKAPPSPDDATSGLRLMMGAGAPKDLFEAFEQRFGVRLVEGYGMSEIGIPLNNSIEHRRPGCCGRPLPQYEVRLVDDDGGDVPDDTPGELLIRPKTMNSMMLEYYRMPEKTVEAWRDLWFHTGDYLKRDADGYYYFVDRKKDALRRRGENISSYEVERGVSAHPAVLESAAVAVASELGEDEVMICLTLHPGQSLEPVDLMRHCLRQMARFMVPRYVRILESLPKTPTERVQKYALRAEGVTADTYDREADPAWHTLLKDAAA